MKLEMARTIVSNIVEARKRWGKLATPPYTDAQLYDALVLLTEAGKFDAPDAEEVTKLRRQLAACQNREKARKQPADNGS